MENSIKEFIAVTGANEETAKQMLDVFSGNLEAAVSSFLDCSVPNNIGPTNAATADDEVRAPIPQTKGVLIEDYDSTPQWMVRHRPRSVFDGFRNFKAEEDSKPGSKRLKRLEDLFRPPLDIMHKGTFATAKAEGTMHNKWLIVNVQNVREFVCQILNRDVWSDTNIKSLIKENFVFWQIYSDSSEGERFINFYNVTEWPHVSVLDPRTAGKMASFKNYSKESVIQQLKDFINDHGVLEAEEKQPPAKRMKHDILDSSEDSQMAAAIAASLREATRSSSSTNNEDSQEEDEDDNFVDASSESRGSPIVVDAVDADDKPDSVMARPKDAGEIAKTAVSVDSQTKNGVVLAPDRSDRNGHSPPKRKLVKIFPKKSPTAGAFERSRDDHSRFVPYKRKESESTEREATTEDTNAVKPGTSSTAKCRLMLRLPDGTREKLVLQENDTLKDLMHMLSSKRLGPDKFEILTNFPQKLLSTMEPTLTLKEAGLCPQDTVFIREKL